MRSITAAACYVTAASFKLKYRSEERRVGKEC